MFLPLREFENRFKSHEGSSYKIDDIDRTIEINRYPSFSFWKWVKKRSKWEWIIFLIFLLILIPSFPTFIFLLCFLPVPYFIISAFRNVVRRTASKTLIDIPNEKIVFTVSYFLIGRKNITVLFHEIKNIGFKRDDQYTNRYDSEKVFAGHTINLIQHHHKKRKKPISYSILFVRNESDAIALVQWFEQVIGLKTSHREEDLKTEQQHISLVQQEITFTKSVSGEDFIPPGFDTVLTDGRLYRVFKNGNLILSVSMDALTTMCFIEYGDESYVIRRISTSRKDLNTVISIPAFDYSVTNYLTQKEVANLQINNVRKSWKCYNATVSFPNDPLYFVWDFKVYRLNDFLSANHGMRPNGGLVNLNQSVQIFSRFKIPGKHGIHISQTPRNQLDVEGYLTLQNTDFNPVLIAITLYLFEMELMPIPMFND